VFLIKLAGSCHAVNFEGKKVHFQKQLM